MKQWDKQGHRGSRCKLSRNLCSTWYFSHGCYGKRDATGTAPRSAPAQRRGDLLKLSQQLICRVERRTPVETNKRRQQGLISPVLSGSAPLGGQEGVVLLATLG